MEYKFRDIEKKWQEWWKEKKIYKVPNDSARPKYYVLDMFPYPSGAGLHVGHPLGYIASDIYTRYKRLKGYNVLHPMGYDAFGLPAEQYAIDHGIHPAISTEQNINNFRKQLDNIGFSFDWDREVRTSDPKYYKWTQWIFLQLFDSWFNRSLQKAERISSLAETFEKQGNKAHPCPGDISLLFTADEWENFNAVKKMDVLMQYRLAYCGYGEVNWCEALGTVLANDEVVNGVSERGGFPVVKKKLRQWYLRITEYADRLLEGLEKVDFSESMKEMQTNWIGKSYGAEISFSLTPNPSPYGEGKVESPELSGHFFQTADKSKWTVLKDLSRENRKKKTEAEDVLWQELRNNKLGYKVRRQHVIDGFIIDFAFTQNKLLIEVDGGYHGDEEQKAYDEARTAYLNFKGYKVLRYSNERVLQAIKEVVDEIRKQLANRISESPESPLSERIAAGGEALQLSVYTTRPDTIFGVDFMVLAPEHLLVQQITTDEHKTEVEKYLEYVNSRSERERMAEKKITGVFTGSYCIHPFSGRKIPVWISEYVLAGYGTGAIMAVPCGDQRDFLFATHFDIPITNIIGDHFNGEEANPTKDAILTNSDFLNGMVMRDAIEVLLRKIEEMGIGKRKINYKMHDAAFSRQRYWGEPIPVAWHDGTAYPLDAKELPVELPYIEDLKPGPEGEGPLANLKEWIDLSGEGQRVRREVNTMPGYAGSSWYFLRYMDPHNEKEFCSRKASDYWGQVDLYIGGTEHAVGHLLYSRMWTKALFDLGYIGHDEPYRKLVNQGKIGGDSRIIYRVNGTNTFVSAGLKDNYETHELHVDVTLVNGFELDIGALKSWKPDYENAEFILENGKYICGSRLEKMSKRYFNVVNPDYVVEKYGADAFRMYEMFLGPVEQDKPWDTKGIEGVHRFLKKLWRLFYDEQKGKVWAEEKATEAELKVLHKTIKRIEENTERFSFNTGVSSFMIAVNELSDLKCHKKEILEPLIILLAPYAPHIAEELYQQLGGVAQVSPTGGDLEGASVLDAPFPKFEENYIRESTKTYPVAINGKTRTELTIALDATQQQVEEIVFNDETVKKWLDGKQPKKVIYVKNKMINVVI